jgi:hypothetical protein
VTCLDLLAVTVENKDGTRQKRFLVRRTLFIIYSIHNNKLSNIEEYRGIAPPSLRVGWYRLPYGRGVEGRKVRKLRKINRKTGKITERCVC